MNSKITYRQQFTRCGKERCHKCKEGAGHGPYWYAYWSVNGRTVSKYLGKNPPEDVEIETSELQQTFTPIIDAVSLPSSPVGQRNVEKDILIESPQPARNVATSNPALRIY